MGLIKLIARTHTDALSELYNRYSRLAFSLALNLVGDYATAEEITLDVFARVWEKAGTYRSDQAVGPSSPSAGMAMARLSPAIFWRVLLLLRLPRCAGGRRPVGHCYRD
jgi:hypothetical protein